MVLYVLIYRTVHSSHTERMGSQTMALFRTVTFTLGTFIIYWQSTFIVLLTDALHPKKTCTIFYQARFLYLRHLQFYYKPTHSSIPREARI